MPRPVDTRHLAFWHNVFQQVPPRELLPDDRTDHYARDLCELDAVELTSSTPAELRAIVTDGARAHRTAFFLLGNSLNPTCTCSSSRASCRHIGAVAYQVLGIFTHGDYESGLDPDDPRVVPGTELSREIARRTAASPARPGVGDGAVSALSGSGGYDPLPDPGIIVETDGSLSSRSGKVSPSEREKVYRPVLEVIRVPDDFDRNAPGESRLYLRAALVYLKKDGSQGALQAYSSGKPRLQAPGLSEHLYRFIASQERRMTPAVASLASELERMHEGTSLDLYFEHEPGTDPVPARPLAMEQMVLDWVPVGHNGVGPLLSPRLSVETEIPDGTGGTRPVTITAEHGESADSDNRLLLIPVPDEGLLLFRFDTPPVIFSLVRLLRDSPRVDLDGAAELADTCRRRLGAVLRVEDPPEELTVLTVVPQPVLRIESVYGYFSIAQLLFRYGDQETRFGGPAIAFSETSVTTTPSEPPAVYRRLPDIEAHYLAVAEEIIGDALEECAGSRTAVFDGGYDCSAGALVRACAAAAFEAGFELRLQDEPVRIASSTPSYRVQASGEGWFDAELGVRVGDEFIPIEDPQHRGGILRARGKLYVFTGADDLERYFAGANRMRVAAGDLATLAFIEENADDPGHEAFATLRTLRERIAAFERLDPIDAPAGLQCTLRPYQLHGLSWLWFLHEYELGGCLADDMGLGKTLQALACLLTARTRDRMERALVIAPVSTLTNWSNEIARFTPGLSARMHAGPGRAKSADELSKVDVVLVSYATVRVDINLFLSLPVDYLILDEAQVVKNPKSKTRAAIRKIPAPHRLALTGTPIENNTVELWSLYDLLMPGMLGTLANFRSRYSRPIEEAGDDDARRRLQRIVHPLLLRRRKREVAQELPEREERLHFCEPGREQLRVYESLRRKFKRSIEERVTRKGIDGARMHILEAMLRLRQAAILPSLVDPDYHSVPSVKLDQLEELVDTIRSEDNKALVFSQFTAVMDEVERRLTDAGSDGGLPCFRIDGTTPQRARGGRIDSFQSHEGSAVFLISLKAGGFGINLTAADYVILLDPWWNPAVEAQAIDRAHRIGRTGHVIAYRLITAGTIEEKMLRLQEHKRGLADSIIRSDAGGLAGLSSEDLEWLFDA